MIFRFPQVLETVFSSAARERKKAAEITAENSDTSEATKSTSLSALATSSLVFDDADYGLHRTHHADVDTTLLVYFFGRRGSGELR